MLKELKDRLKDLFCKLPQRNKPKIIGVDLATGEDQTGYIKVTAEMLKNGDKELQEMENGIRKRADEIIEEITRRENRKNANNWRKMHGQPMRRKKTGQKKKKIGNKAGGGDVGNERD